MSSFIDAVLSPQRNWYYAVFGGLLILFVAGFYLRSSKSKYPLPPGPKGSPIIGNLRQVPAERSDVQFAKWAKEFKSDIIYINLMGQPVIVLSSLETAVDLLERRGTIYSDRPPFVLLEALGFKNNMALIGDTAQYRKLRKAYGTFLSARNSLAYRDMQLNHARKMAHDIEKHPEKWLRYISQFTTRIIFSMAFAIDIPNEDDPYFDLADKMGWAISNMGNNGITIIDIAPWTQHLPRWIGNFIPSVKFVQDHKPSIEEFHQRPFDEVMRNFKAGKSERSFLGSLLEAREMNKGDAEEAMKSFTDGEIKGTGGSVYSAGQDTTYATTTIFVMAMVLNPEVQTRAQKEIDSVTQGRRLPTFEDWKVLPIVERIVYETFRFHPAVPNGVPHRTLKEDVYRGMYIPKGKSVVIANSWAMLHDPDVYKHSFKFNPDRFLPVSEGGSGEPIPTSQFGFGRRVCPGQYLALASVWIAVATLLAKFDISPAKDKDGIEIMPEYEFSTGITSHPKPFPCFFTLRNSL